MGKFEDLHYLTKFWGIKKNKALILMETFILAVMVFQLCLSLTYVSVGHRYGCFMDRNCMISFFLVGVGWKRGLERRSLSHFR